MRIGIKKSRVLQVGTLSLISLFFFSTCKEASTLAPCVSKFYYDGSPFRQGTNSIITPSYDSGEDITGEFTSTPGLVILDKAKGTLDLGASVPGVYTVRKTMIGNPSCGNRISLGVISILPPLAVFSLAEDLIGWNYTGVGFLDKTDKKEGESSIKISVNSGIVILKFLRSEPLNTKITADVGQFSFWLYISDPSRLEGGSEIGQIELTSSGDSDIQEFTWPIIPANYNFKVGWNQMVLKFKDARITGGAPNLSAINFLRIYMYPNAGVNPIVIGVDDMKIMADL